LLAQLEELSNTFALLCESTSNEIVYHRIQLKEEIKPKNMIWSCFISR